MRQLHSIVTERGKVRHLATEYTTRGPFHTLCGLLLPEARVDEIENRRNETETRICRNCVRARKNSDMDTVLPAVDEAAALRGRELADNGSIIEIEARVYRVQGSTDWYTVTVPTDPDFASLCTCMAAKTHPNAMCKHQAAAFLYEAREMNDEG